MLMDERLRGRGGVGVRVGADRSGIRGAAPREEAAPWLRLVYLARFCDLGFGSATRRTSRLPLDSGAVEGCRRPRGCASSHCASACRIARRAHVETSMKSLAAARRRRSRSSGVSRICRNSVFGIAPGAPHSVAQRVTRSYGRPSTSAVSQCDAPLYVPSPQAPSDQLIRQHAPMPVRSPAVPSSNSVREQLARQYPRGVRARPSCARCGRSRY